MIIGHRGGRRWAPENTLAAFEKCLDPDTRLDGIELDVQRCASGELVVIHDDDVGRTTNGVGQVRDISLDELKRLSAGLWFDRAFADQRIPT
ncbi:MAG TPA: glycerophosphodiester phosphodiesterase family protein, partial [Chroococcales cyanobacterium]